MERPTRRIVAAEIQRDGRWLVTQRAAHAVLPLLWEFPGGRVRDGETEEEALVRALAARIGVVAVPIERLFEVTHDYEDYAVVMAVWRCEIGDRAPWPATVAGVAWVAPEEFADYPFPGADQRTLDLLLDAS